MSRFTTTVECNPGAAAHAVALPPLPAVARDGRESVQSLSRDIRKLFRQMGPQAFDGSRHRGGGFGRSYAGANLQRRDPWLAGNLSGDAALAQGADLLVSRSRDLMRNEPTASAARARIVENTIGEEGIICESAIAFDGESIAENRLIDDAARRWCEEEADAEGELSWYEMQQVAMGEVPEAGETILYKCASTDRNRLLPLCYQLLEGEQLDRSRNHLGDDGQNVIKQGIEFDKQGRKVAYWIFTDHPHDLVPMRTWVSKRVDASRIIHYYRKSRPSLHRGVPWLAPVLRLMRNFNGYFDSEMDAAHAASHFAVAVMRANGGGSGLGFGDDEDGEECLTDASVDNLQNLYGSIIADLQAGDDIKQVQATRPNPQAEPWIQLILNSMANGMGMTYLGLTGDVRKASYSSARFAQVVDKRFYRPLQRSFGRGVALKVRREVVKQLAVYERVDGLRAQQVAANPYVWLRTRMRGPGWEEIDKIKEITGTVEKIRAGLGTFQDECAAGGGGWRANIDAMAEVLEYAEEKLGPYGVKLTWMYPTDQAAVAEIVKQGDAANAAEETD